MNNLLPDPQRWKDVTTQANLAERTAGETVRALGQPGPLTSVQLGRIAARIRSARAQRRRYLLPVVAALLLGIATGASAAHLDLLPSWLGGSKVRSLWGTPHASPSVAPPRKPRAAAPATPAAATGTAAGDALPGASVGAGLPGTPPTNADDPIVAPTPSRAAHPVRVVPGHTEGAPPAPSAPAPQSPASTEPSAPVAAAPGRRLAWLAPPAPLPSAVPTAPEVPQLAAAAPAPGRAGEAAKHLSQAIRLLRTERNAKAALALLDARADELARQGLGHETLIVRVEALLDLERNTEALRLLDGATLSDAAASRALLVTRGKLRAAAHRCADGIGDFTLVLAETHAADRQALWGRALCRQQLGDGDGARADLERYRREFPGDERLPALEKRLHHEP